MKKPEQTLAEAVEFIVLEAMRGRPTKTAYGKVVKALWAIGLDDTAVSRLLHVMDYADSKGQPYRWLFEKRNNRARS